MRENYVAEESAKPKRRTIKKVESVRERAEKAGQETPQKSGVVRLTLHYIAVPFKPIARPVGKGAKKLGRLKPFRILGNILVPPYFRNSWKELRHVTWPTRRESWQLTSAVIIFAIIFGVMIAIVDYGLDKVFKQVLLK
jgi:preprotein translocase SecE subunit